MKRTLILLPVLFSAVLLAACGALAGEVTTAPETTTAAPSAVVFRDPVLEEMVREALGKPEGDITLEEAEATRELKLGIEWEQQIPEQTQIKDIGGLEKFVNLESLDLSFHAVEDIAPLAGLSKLTSLELGGNPVADIAPLAGLTNLNWLTLFNCQAQDYGPLANLTQLGGIMLDHSTITDVGVLAGLTGLQRLSLSNTQVKDVSPLVGLVNLRNLYLENCPITDYSPLAQIYAQLQEKDFVMAASLRELGFTAVGDSLQIESYKTEDMIVQVHHADWGERENKDEANAVVYYRNFDQADDLGVIYYPDSETYLVTSHSNDFRYTCDGQSKAIHMEYGEERANAFVEKTYENRNDVPLFTPIDDFCSVIEETFGFSPDTLYDLKREAVDTSSLAGLGFAPQEQLAAYLYEQYEPRYYSIEVHNPAWGAWEEGGDVRFFTPLSDEYRIVITYFTSDRKYLVKADDNAGGGASFELLADTAEHIDGWCSDASLTVEQYFVKAFNDPEIEDVYLFAVKLMEDAVDDCFGLRVEELYALPAGM